MKMLVCMKISVLYFSISMQGPKLPETFLSSTCGLQDSFRSCIHCSQPRGKEHGVGMGDFNGTRLSQGTHHLHSYFIDLFTLQYLTTTEARGCGQLRKRRQLRCSANICEIIFARNLKKLVKTSIIFEKILHTDKPK